MFSQTNIPVQQAQSPSTNVTSFTDFVGTTLAGAIKSSTETLVTQELARVVANFTTVEEKIRTTQATVNVPLDQTTSYELLYDFSTSESIFVTDSPVAANESSLTNDSVIPSNVTILKTLTVRENDTVPEIKVNNTLVLSMNNENSSLLTSTGSLQNITSEIKSSTVDSSAVALEIAVAVSDSTTNAAESVTDIRTGAIVVNSQDGVDKVTTEAPILKAQTTTTAPAVKTQASTAAPIVKAPTPDD
ncbi:hypothetical protein DPMN_132552 [Dreissena polymorpha]|uniref:Uncharacterized protein n=1 Tax=Dreissena polymorpha TaxID=45954 RepID=A0A9D4FW66_DREPO|nr:hypothetical protein DPMN_132552 [Dreissena polymorpha]